MKNGIIIQARTGSSRLHNKILLPFYGQERIIDIIIRNIKYNYPDNTVILATTERKEDNILADIALEAEIECFRGEENNVLKRFIDAADKFKLDTILRVCSDNPFLQVSSFRELFEAYDIKPAQYISYGFPDGKPVIKSHLGLFGELVTLEGLKLIRKKTNEYCYLEHVTNYMYTHPQDFTVSLLPLPSYLNNRNDLRLTVDTMEDFKLMQNLYAHWYEGNDHTVEAMIRMIDANPENRELMKINILNNEK